MKIDCVNKMTPTIVENEKQLFYSEDQVKKLKIEKITAMKKLFPQYTECVTIEYPKEANFIKQPIYWQPLYRIFKNPYYFSLHFYVKF